MKPHGAGSSALLLLLPADVYNEHRSTAAMPPACAVSQGALKRPAACAGSGHRSGLLANKEHAATSKIAWEQATGRSVPST